MKRFIKYIGILAVLACVGAVAAYFLAKKYEPEVRDIILAELNENLAVEVDVEDINLSLFQRFPYASLRFSNVVVPKVLDGIQSKDTLLFAHDLYLQIGLLDFLVQDYTVSEAELNTGFFDMELFEYGDNYHFWKPKSDSTSGSGFSITNVEIKNFEYHLSTASTLDIRLRIDEGSASGNFGDAIYEIKSESDLFITSIVHESDTLYRDEPVSGDITLDINHKIGIYDFKGDDLEISDESYAVKGRFEPKSADKQWDVSLSSTSTQLTEVLSLIPIKTRAKLSKYGARGDSDLQIQITSGEDFHLEVDFENLEGSFQNNEALGTAELNNAAGKFSLHNGYTALNIQKLDASIGPGEIHTWGEIKNLAQPEFNISLSGNLDLDELKSLINLQTVETLTGNLIIDGRLEGKIAGEDKKEIAERLQGVDFKGDIQIENGSFKMKGQGQLYHDINGDMKLANNAIVVESASANVNESAFEIKGSIQNVLPYITQKGQRLDIDANFSAAHLDLNQILSTDESASDTSYFFQLPQNVSFDMNIEIATLEFRSFEAVQITGRASYTKGMLTLNPFQFQTASGSIKSNLSISESKDKTQFNLELRSQMKELELNELFSEFENFGQNVIQAENVNGRANASLYFAASFSNDLKINTSTIESELDLDVIDGELVNVPAIQEIGDHLAESALYRSAIDIPALRKQLKKIEFDTLSNHISIQDRKIHIPKMKVVSSALTMNVSGEHTFDNEIDYAINFRLSDILKKRKPNENEFGNIVDDGTGLRLFIKMSGTTDSPVFAMDKEGARSKRSEQFEEEKQTFKSIMKDEFGFFKKDSTLIKVTEEKSAAKTQFTVEWGDSTISKTDSTKASTKPKTKPKPPSEDDDIYDELEGDDDL